MNLASAAPRFPMPAVGDTPETYFLARGDGGHTRGQDHGGGRESQHARLLLPGRWRHGWSLGVRRGR
jgi:hypothetical protein